MKASILAWVSLFCLFTESSAQHVRVRLDFPAGAIVRPVGVAPFRGAVWIGPEWRWQRGRYVYVPGYWARPNRRGSIWIPGYWNTTRRGHIWVPGRWR